MEDIITNKTVLLKSFWLYFLIANGNGSEFIDYDLPPPTYLRHLKNGDGYFIGWAIDGYFGTAKGRDFLNDVIARFLLSFHDEGITRLPFKPTKKDLDNTTARIYAKIYSLRAFSKQLKSVPTKKKYVPRRAENYEDFTFWAIKLYAEDTIRKTGFIVYESLEAWAFSQFLDKVSHSTLKAKCKAVYFWYENRDFELPKWLNRKTLKQHLEDTMATRREHIIQLNKSVKERNKRAIINLLTGLYASDYKKKSGAWHYIKIAEATGLSRPTVSKLVKEIEKEGVIKPITEDNFK